VTREVIPRGGHEMRYFLITLGLSLGIELCLLVWMGYQ
jgi:hypothetical protein